jgi:hexosaminidase
MATLWQGLKEIRMHAQLSLLFPRPQQLEAIDTSHTLPDSPRIYLASSPQRVHAIARRLKEELRAVGLRPELTGTVVCKSGRPDVQITLQINSSLLDKPESYRLSIDDTGITLLGADEAGLFYGVCTLNQLIRLQASDVARRSLTLPGLRITDWPDFANRGVMLDVSRDKVPTMETLYALVDLLASWKINQMQLYMEHIFAYRGHEVVWQNASPFTGEEILALDAYCRSRHVELVPNQNSFGHMERWLTHEPYNQLAECPEGTDHYLFYGIQAPHDLCPTDPGSPALLTDLYDQLLPHFSSCQFHVGLDQSCELGLGRSADVCAEKGIGRVYLDFLKQVYTLATQRGRTIQFWADIMLAYPELIGELPKDVIAMEWGYEADHPFDEHCRSFAAAGRSFYVCPGTGTFNTFAGRTENALINLSNAAVAGQATGAIGYLNTSWGDNGHMEPLLVSFLGFLAGAGFSWNSADAVTPHTLDLPALLDVHAFRDKARVMGQLAYDLGNAYLHTGAHTRSSSALFWLVVFLDRIPRRYCRSEELTAENLEKTLHYVDRVTAPLTDARMERPDAELITEEFQWVSDVLRLACHLGIARVQVGFEEPVSAIPVEVRTELANQLRQLIERHRQIWLRRNRPGGLDDSTARLERVLSLLME